MHFLTCIYKVPTATPSVSVLYKLYLSIATGVCIKLINLNNSGVLTEGLGDLFGDAVSELRCESPPATGVERRLPAPSTFT